MHVFGGHGLTVPTGTANDFRPTVLVLLPLQAAPFTRIAPVFFEESDPLETGALFIHYQKIVSYKKGEDLGRDQLGGVFVRFHHQFRIERSFIGIVDPGEAFQLSASRFLVEALGVACFAHLDGRIDKDLDKAESCFPVEVCGPGPAPCGRGK